jgi:hypothetical protein
MTKTAPQREWYEPTLAQMRAGPPEPIDDNWKDDIVERLLRELKRQLCQLENTKPTQEIDQAAIRQANVATLASIERTLEKLLHLHQQMALAQETKKATKHDDAIAALERRLDKLLAAPEAPPVAAEPEQ